ncbi:MAG TPA: M1 family metallopeptidase [Gemmatimonadales bacterium]
MPDTLKSVLLPWMLATVAACSAGAPATAPAGPAPAPRAAQPAPPTAMPPALRLEIPESFSKAVERGTRTMTGLPGPNYWQQYATYRLQAELNPVLKRLTGRGRVVYYNRSPDTLPVVYVQAYQNLFRPDAKRNQQTPKLGGIDFDKVMVGGKTLSELAKPGEPGYTVNGTVMEIRLPAPLVPRDSLVMDFEWQFRVQSETAPRGGQDGEVWFISYWYPQMVVYDDFNGWQTDQYLGRGEFYMGYADYDVRLTVPTGWVLDATGALENPGEVLSPQTRARLDSARSATGIVHVVTEKDKADSLVTLRGADGKLTWHWTARNVRDFVWGTSPRYLWDATRAITDSANGQVSSSLVSSLYRPEGVRSYWDEAARYGRHAVEFFSRKLWPYPYPHMTPVDGPDGCGGMEYPMMTCIGGTYDSLTMYEVVSHEIGHMWFPMMVGSDEKRYAWMDEGFTQYDQSQAMADFFKGFDDEARNRDYYLRGTEAGYEEEIMKPADKISNDAAYGVAAYWKPATVLVALRTILGRETFEKAFREYGQRWLGKHPTPWDFWNTFNDVTGQDLSWFWKEWFYETWKLDQALDTVRVEGDSAAIVLENRGRIIMPVPLAITREGGAVERVQVPVNVWFGGERRYTLYVASKPKVTKVELDPDHALPDIDRSGQIWPRGPAVRKREGAPPVRRRRR